MFNSNLCRSVFLLCTIACLIVKRTNLVPQQNREEPGRNHDNEQHGKPDNARKLQPNAWYVDWSRHQCAKNCKTNSAYPSCGGLLKLRKRQDHVFDSAESCCASRLSWLPMNECTRGGISKRGAVMKTVKTNDKKVVNKNRKRKNNMNPNMQSNMQSDNYFNPSDDAFVDKFSPSKNFDTNTLEFNSDEVVTLVRFDLSGISKKNVQETQYTLHLYSLGQCNSRPKIEVVSENWAEDRVTWYNAPDQMGPKKTKAQGSDNLKKNKWLYVDVTDAVLWSVNRQNHVTFRISGSNDELCRLASKEYQKGKYSPSLELRSGENLRPNSNTSPTKTKNSSSNPQGQKGPRPKKQSPKNTKPKRPKPRPLASDRDGLNTDGILLQQQGDSCDMQRYRNGEWECPQGLVCHPNFSNSNYGTCEYMMEANREPRPNAKPRPSQPKPRPNIPHTTPRGEVFDLDDILSSSPEDNYSPEDTTGPNAWEGDECDASYGPSACLNGFECLRGICSISQAFIPQDTPREGDPCDIAQYRLGERECPQGLVCYHSNGDRSGEGFCAIVGVRAGVNQACDAYNNRANACAVGFECVGANGSLGVDTGICKRTAATAFQTPQGSPRGPQGVQDPCDMVGYPRREGECAQGLVCLHLPGAPSSYGICTSVDALSVYNEPSGPSPCYGPNDCGQGFYCSNSGSGMSARNSPNGGGQGENGGGYSGAVISGPSGTVNSAWGGNNGGGMSVRNSPNGGAGNGGGQGENGGGYSGAVISGPSGTVNSAWGGNSGGWNRERRDQYTGAVIPGPSGQIVTGQGGNTNNGGGGSISARSTGNGMCAPATGYGQSCNGRGVWARTLMFWIRCVNEHWWCDSRIERIDNMGDWGCHNWPLSINCRTFNWAISGHIFYRYILHEKIPCTSL